MTHKITLPIDLNGERYGIRFFRGVGETNSERIAALMKEKGFTVEEVGTESIEPIEPTEPTRRSRKGEEKD